MWHDLLVKSHATLSYVDLIMVSSVIIVLQINDSERIKLNSDYLNKRINTIAAKL